MNAAKTQIRSRITHVGSEYRRDVTSGICELCIADWSARIRDISFELADVNTSATWQATTPTLHVGRWNDSWVPRQPLPPLQSPRPRHPRCRRGSPE